MKSTKMNFTQIYSADCFLSLNLVKRGPMPMQTLTGRWLDTKKIRTRYGIFVRDIFFKNKLLIKIQFTMIFLLFIYFHFPYLVLL